MKTTNHFLQCLYMSSATAIIICGVLVYTWHYNNGSLSSQQLEEDIYPTVGKYIIYRYIATSLSTIVLYLIVGIGTKSYGFRKISCFKNQPCNRFYLKKPAEIHW